MGLIELSVFMERPHSPPISYTHGHPVCRKSRDNLKWIHRSNEIDDRYQLKGKLFSERFSVSIRPLIRMSCGTWENG